ncbi:MAG: hypothetical protein Q9183_005404, partial [Haloplaca sp. 2 TL-2023]
GRSNLASNEQTYFDDSAVHWAPATSKNGVSYEIGVMDSDHAPHSSGMEDFGTCVDWPLGNSDWKSTSDELMAKTAITRYALHHSRHPLYDFVLEFTNTENYNYYFYDTTGDSYQVNTGSKGDHLVRFNSKQSTIRFVTGS